MCARAGRKNHRAAEPGARAARRIRSRHRSLGRSVPGGASWADRRPPASRSGAGPAAGGPRAICRVHARLARCDAQIAAHVRNSPAGQRASELLGVGPVTASALAATVPDARVFRSGRQFGAWLGLAPRQHSSGGKTRLGRISLRGNVYLRTLLIQGARSTLQAAINTEPARAGRLQRWIIALYGRKGYYKTLIAIANKHARILWAMLAKDEHYDAAAWQRHPVHQPPLAGNA